MALKIIGTVFIFFLLQGCSQERIFPIDHKEYDNPKNYPYQYSEHTFFSQDDTDVYGLYIKTDKTPKGLIVLANGMYQNMSFRFPKWLWIVDAGYDLFTFDYRGYGKSYADADIFGFRDDARAALEYAHGLDEKKKIIFIGQSLGATLMIDVLKNKHYDYVSLAVADSAFTGFASSTSALMMKSIILFPISWVPYTFFPDELNSIENIEFVKTPILFVAGDRDFVVNYTNSKKLYAKANEPKSLWIVKGAGHVRSFNTTEVQKAFLELLKNPNMLSDEEERYFK